VSGIFDWRSIERHRGRESAVARGTIIVRLVAAPVRPRVSLAALLLIGVAVTVLPGRLARQNPAESAGTFRARQVVVEQAPGGVDLPPAAATARLVPVDGVVRDTLDGATLGGARIELLGTRFITRSTEDGHFRLEAVPAGRYTVASPAGLRADHDRRRADPRGASRGPAQRFHAPPQRRAVGDDHHAGPLRPVAGGVAGASRCRGDAGTVPQLGRHLPRRVTGCRRDDGRFSAKFGVRGGSGDELYVSLDGSSWSSRSI